MGTEDTERLVLSTEQCWECVFCEEPFCRYYHRHFEYNEGQPERKAKWCKLERVILEFRRS